MTKFEPTQETIQERQRNVRYVNSRNKTGTFSPEIGADVAERIRSFCAERNLNKTRFVEEACAEKINRELRKELETMSEEEKTVLLSQLLGLG